MRSPTSRSGTQARAVSWLQQTLRSVWILESRLSLPGWSDPVWALSDGERKELESDRDDRVLTEIWTAKEAVGKAIGVGLQARPTAIDSWPMPSEPSRRRVKMPSGHGAVAQLDSHGIWWGNYHVRIAWAL
ncbi:4-phosphopantetheinyl transferase family protein [Auritidibacter sp. NML130574]|uniref:4'-phosphopantetheinyl transferase superfamily protein n=1 Tax=Auritidibacter TaxID=1160973 RepID=UPI000D729B06|nr:4-phosphopantetheinyl transferase family protein [Auritidibacter sp. NML130574]